MRATERPQKHVEIYCPDDLAADWKHLQGMIHPAKRRASPTDWVSRTKGRPGGPDGLFARSRGPRAPGPRQQATGRQSTGLQQLHRRQRPRLPTASTHASGPPFIRPSQAFTPSVAPAAPQEQNIRLLKMAHKYGIRLVELDIVASLKALLESTADFSVHAQRTLQLVQLGYELDLSELTAAVLDVLKQQLKEVRRMYQGKADLNTQHDDYAAWYQGTEALRVWHV